MLNSTAREHLARPTNRSLKWTAPPNKRLRTDFQEETFKPDHRAKEEIGLIEVERIEDFKERQEVECLGKILVKTELESILYAEENHAPAQLKEQIRILSLALLNSNVKVKTLEAEKVQNTQLLQKERESKVELEMQKRRIENEMLLIFQDWKKSKDVNQQLGNLIIRKEDELEQTKADLEQSEISNKALQAELEKKKVRVKVEPKNYHDDEFCRQTRQSMEVDVQEVVTKYKRLCNKEYSNLAQEKLKVRIPKTEESYPKIEKKESEFHLREKMRIQLEETTLKYDEAKVTIHEQEREIRRLRRIVNGFEREMRKEEQD